MLGNTWSSFGNWRRHCLVVHHQGIRSSTVIPLILPDFTTWGMPHKQVPNDKLLMLSFAIFTVLSGDLLLMDIFTLAMWKSMLSLILTRYLFVFMTVQPRPDHRLFGGKKKWMKNRHFFFQVNFLTSPSIILVQFDLSCCATVQASISLWGQFCHKYHVFAWPKLYIPSKVLTF